MDQYLINREHALFSQIASVTEATSALLTESGMNLGAGLPTVVQTEVRDEGCEGKV